MSYVLVMMILVTNSADNSIGVSTTQVEYASMKLCQEAQKIWNVSSKIKLPNKSNAWVERTSACIPKM